MKTHSMTVKTFDDKDMYVCFAYNSDLSGNVLIQTNMQDGKEGQKMNIPAEAILRFVSGCIKDQKIKELEQAPDYYFLGLVR